MLARAVTHALVGLEARRVEGGAEVREQGMPAYVRIQAGEFAREADGYTATRHQREAGTGYFDQVLQAVTGGQASTAALMGRTEKEQFALRESGS